VPTTKDIRKARKIANKWIPKVEAALRKFKKEYCNPFTYGYLETHLCQAGHTPETATSVGAFWFIRGDILWLNVSLDGDFTVSLERPLGNDIGVGKDLKEKLIHNLKDLVD